MKEYIGIDIGGTKCAVVLGNERGEIVRKLRFPTQGRDETLKRILRARMSCARIAPPQLG